MLPRLYHVTTAKKLRRYKEKGYIKPPVRAWKSLERAMSFSESTGRRVIIRLIDRGQFEEEERDGTMVKEGDGMVSYEKYVVKNI